MIPQPQFTFLLEESGSTVGALLNDPVLTAFASTDIFLGNVSHPAFQYLIQTNVLVDILKYSHAVSLVSSKHSKM